MLMFAGKEEKALRDYLDGLGSKVELAEEVKALKEQLEDAFKSSALTEQVLDLKRQIADLQIAKSKIEEDFARQERDLRHMIGLEKKRQEAEAARLAVEMEQAKRGAMLDVREENLAKDRERFEQHLTFNNTRYEKTEAFMKGMLDEIINRLPSANIDVIRTEHRDRKG